MIEKISNLKFKHYLFLPSGIVVFWLILNIIGSFSDAFRSSNIVENITIVIAVLYALFLLFVSVVLIIKKKYRQLVGLLLGLPLAYGIFFISAVLILSGILG